MFDDFRPIDWYRRALWCALDDERRCLKAQVCQEYTGPELDQRLAEIRTRIADANAWIQQYEEGVRQDSLKYDELFPGAKERREEVLKGILTGIDWTFKFNPPSKETKMGEAKRRGTAQQRQAAAEEELRQFKESQERRQREQDKEKQQAAIDLYRREVKEFGEEEADRRHRARKDARHQRYVRNATFFGMLSGMMQKPAEPKPFPTSLDDFENL